MPLAPDSPEVAQIDAALAEWRQGDLALEEHWFVHLADGSQPLTAASEQADDGLQALSIEVDGLVLVTQTCDVVRSCTERPFVEVAPLVEVSGSNLRAIERCRRPAYAVIPTVKDRQLVAHLDRVMTVEKSVVAAWERTSGCPTDQARRDFAQALVRKRARVAFPDDFTAVVADLLVRLQDKHDKNSVEGRALRALREICVCAAPDWEAPEVEIALWFGPYEDELEFEGEPWHQHLEQNHDHPQTVADLARRVSQSQRTFERRFKAATGDTPVRYLQRVRVEAAKRLLEQTAETFEQITFRVGYEDPASFRRVFQTQTGLTPNPYRQRFASPLSIAG